MLLSIAMIVKNEELNIERCLKALNSLNGEIDYEIIIVDTGSDDKTVEIAKKYTNKIYFHKWENDFSKMRNISIGYCSGEWILILDADEVLENSNTLKNFLNDNKNNYKSGIINLKNIISKDENEYIIGSLTRLFRNCKECFYTGAVHEQPNVLLPVKHTNINVIHYGYSRESYKVMRYKYERNRELLLGDLRNGKKTAYTYFQLAQTYSMANERVKALDCIKKSFVLAKETNESWKYLYVYHRYAIELLLRGNAKKAIEICEEALTYINEHIDFYYMLAKAYVIINDYKKAETYIEKYLDLWVKIKDGLLIEDISLTIVSFCKKNDLFRDIVLYKYKEEKYEDVVLWFNKIEEQSIKSELRSLYLYALISLENYDEVAKYYDSNNVEDEDIQIIIDSIEKVNSENLIVKSRLYQNLINIDERLMSYINCIYMNNQKKIYSKEVQFEKFYQWKAVLFKYYLLNNWCDIEVIRGLENEEILRYIAAISDDFGCIEKLYSYSEKKFPSQDINELIFIINIEEVLILNKSIDDNEHKKLMVRLLINKFNYFNKIYKEEVFEYIDLENIIPKKDVFWIDIKKSIEIYDEDKLLYTKKIGDMLRKFPEHKQLIQICLDEVKDNIVNQSIKEEKLKFVSATKSLLEESQFEKASEVLLQLNAWFKYDKEILNLLGIAQYSVGNFNDAILNLALSNIMDNKDFDSKFNLACVLEANEQIDSAKVYYEQALVLNNDNEMKKYINTILNSLDKK